MIKKTEQVVQEKWVPSFQFEEHEDRPFTVLKKPVSESKGVLISTGGFYPRGAAPFQDNYGLGDPSYREISIQEDPHDLSISHQHYDHTNAKADPNVGFPIERLQEMTANKEIGVLAAFHYSFMGYVPIAHTLKTMVLPGLIRRLKQEEVDFAVLSPS